MITPVALAGARDKLLPADLPILFFGTALLAHAAAWLVLGLAAADLPGFDGGLGRPLAALHLVTLGVLLPAAIGAGCQLLPVAAHSGPPSLWACRLAGLLLVPGMAALTWGMAGGAVPALSLGGLVATAGLLLFALAFAVALVRGHGPAALLVPLWSALLLLPVLGVLGLTLTGDFIHGYLANHRQVAGLHLAIATYGGFGLLILGFGQVLVPMFLVTEPPPARPVLAVSAVIVLALAGATAGFTVLAAAAGLVAALIYGGLMLRLFRRRLRQAAGPSFALVRIGWAALPLSLGLALGLAGGWLPPRWAPLFGFVLVAGWLLSFTLGMAQRILPFLAAMHAARAGRRMPRVTALSAEPLLRGQAACHAAALVLVAAGLVLDSTDAIRLGAAAGLAGALALIIHAVILVRRTLALPARTAPLPTGKVITP